MLSNSSRIVIFISISSLAVYIGFLYYPVSLSESFGQVLEREARPNSSSATKAQPIKDNLEPASKEEKVLESATQSEAAREPIAVNNNVTVPRVQETKKGVYVTLETQHSDMEYESYEPTISPCVTPMGYKIGKFDPQFNLSREKFLEITREAVAMWEEAAGTSLFTNDPTNGSLILNLIYDERQATTVSLGYLALEIENTKQAAEDTRTAYEREKVSYIRDSEIFNNEATVYQNRFASYNEKVKKYNENGGATRAEYDAMMIELEELKKEADGFETRRLKLNQEMDAINAKVKRYNELVEYVNGLIRKSNSIGSRTFTEGRFVPAINTIDIFQYSDETKLRRVLMHEFGHALGIGHVENVHSIMYSFNSGTSTFLSDEDKVALRKSCTSR